MANEENKEFMEFVESATKGTDYGWYLQSHSPDVHRRHMGRI